MAKVDDLDSLCPETLAIEAGQPPIGIADGFVRLSAGLESVEDLWSDLQQALSSS